jgi:hypothetical protein
MVDGVTVPGPTLDGAGLTSGVAVRGAPLSTGGAVVLLGTAGVTGSF